MKKTILSLFVLATLSAFVSCKEEATKTTESNETVAASPEATSYKIDLANSVVNWKGSKPTGTHTGTINFVEGQAMLNGDKLESGTFVFDMNSITVTDLKAGDGKEDLEMHLKRLEDMMMNLNKKA